MKIYLVTVDEETAYIINRAEAENSDIFIGDFTEKRAVKEIELYVNISDD